MKLLAHRVDEPTRCLRLSLITRGSMAILAIPLLLTIVVTSDLALETSLLSSRCTLVNANEEATNNSKVENGAKIDDSSTCSPIGLNFSEVEYHSGHRYYSMLQDLSPMTPPVFNSNHASLCNNSDENRLAFEYCLPISGRKDTSFCAGADRMDLLTLQASKSHCYASVLHMLLLEVYEELEAFDKKPVLVYGSLLGAIRNGSMIPYTEDADIGYDGKLEDNSSFRTALVAKGYHVFFLDIWRVCVSPTHPLASKLYDSSLPITGNFAVPYLDLYAMEKLNETSWRLEMYGDSLLPAPKVEPFSQVTINGLPLNTVYDPNYFLMEMYGTTYMTPQPRE